MKRTHIIISSVLSLAAILAGSASLCAQKSQRLSAGKGNEYGLVYTLPLTAIDVYIEAELTEEHPGEFQNYARRHLGVTDAIKTATRSARVLSATIVPRGIVDPEEQWLAQFKAGSTPYMTLTAEGFPLAINTEEVPAIDTPVVPGPRAAGRTALETPEARQAVTQEMARSSSASKRAELAAQRIFELRETRSDILSGQAENAPSDGKAMELVLNNLSAQEAALTAMFTGTHTDRTVVERFTIVPDSTGNDRQVLARLSAVDGLVEADNLAGAPIEISIEVIARGELPENEKGEEKTFPKGGVAYRIPGKARVTVTFDGRTVASEEVSLAQLGVVFGLNPALFSDRKAPSKVLFDPRSGAVLQLGPAN